MDVIFVKPILVLISIVIIERVLLLAIQGYVLGLEYLVLNAAFTIHTFTFFTLEILSGKVVRKSYLLSYQFFMTFQCYKVV